MRFGRFLFHLFVVPALILPFASGAGAQPVQGGMPLLFYEDFEDGPERWEFTDPEAWRITQEGANHVLSLYQQSDYQPPVRSPHNVAFIKNLWVSDFILEARLKSTQRVYPHRSLCLFFGWQDSAHFYYTHLAPQADPHANSVFIVDGVPRASIADERTEGTTWGDAYHTVRIVRDADQGTIEVYFDDLSEPIMTATDTSFTYGRLGLGSFDDIGRFDEVRVWGVRVADPTLTDERLLTLFEGLRVADVSDAMDVVGLRDVGLVSTQIQPLWRDVSDMSHTIRGIAVTARYVPTNRPVPNPMTEEAFSMWEGRWYSRLSAESFVEKLRPGSVVVIDASGNGDTGSIGSFNALSWYAQGARGIVTTGSVRDTDELIKQRIPVYLDPEQRGRGIRPGRNELESVNEPVEIGGVLVHPGDVVVADGDGVIVVPRAYAVPVARIARQILRSDKAARRALYEHLGRPLDPTVLPQDSLAQQQ